MAKKLAFDKVLFAAVVALVALGLVMVYSAGGAVAERDGVGYNFFLVKQSIAAALGLGVMLLLMQVDYRRLKSPTVVYGGLAVAVALLVAVLFAQEINGSRRWLPLGPLSFQASELAKLVLLLYLAYQAERREDDPGQRELLLVTVPVVLLLAALVQAEPDLGTAAMLAGGGFLVLFLTGLRWRWVLISGAVAGALVTFLVIAEPYRMERIHAFLDPGVAPLEEGYQPRQSLIAIGSGGLTGVGAGESRQKLLFLPHPHSDFVFSIVAEELGLAGGLLLLGLLALFVARGVRAGLRAPDVFGRYLAWGFTLMLAVQALLNVSVAVALVPTTGITLPFISYGGSSLSTTVAACGVLLNVSEHA